MEEIKSRAHVLWPHKLCIAAVSAFIAIMLTLLSCVSLFVNQASAKDDTYAYEFTSWGSFAGDVENIIKQQAPQTLTIGTSIQEIGDARIGWSLAEMRGERTGFFNQGPYRAPFGTDKKSKHQTLTFDTHMKTRVHYLLFDAPSQVYVEQGTSLLFDEVTFKGKVILRGFAEFKNCVFESGSTVIFEKGHASYTGTTNTPHEEGEKDTSNAFVPLSLTVTPEQKPLPYAFLNKAYSAQCSVEVAGTHKDKAVLSVLSESLNDAGLSASLSDDKTKLIISGTPTKAGTYTVGVEASAPAKDESAPRETVQQSVRVTVYPPVELVLVGTPQVVTRHTAQYQQNLKVQVKVGDSEPIDLATFEEKDPDAAEMSDIKVLTPGGFPTGMTAYFANAFNQVVVAGDNPECDFAGKTYRDFPIKLVAHIKGQDVESNETKLRVYDSEVSLKQQLAGVYQDEGTPERWEMQPYFIYTSDGARIPQSMKVLMGSDCHNSEIDKKETEASAPTAERHSSTTHAASHERAVPAPVKAASDKTIAEVKRGDTIVFHDDKTGKTYPDLIQVSHAEGMSASRLHPVDAITMASSGGSTPVIPGDGGAGGSGSCYYGVLGKGQKGNYATDILYIPAGTDVEFLNMKVLSSIKIVIEDGGHLTLDDSAVFGIIEVQKGGCISAKNSSSIMGKVVMQDGSRMKDFVVKSHTNSVDDGNDVRPYPESVVEINGKVIAEGTNTISGDCGPDFTDVTKDSQTGLLVKKGAELSIPYGSTVEVTGGNSEVYTTEGAGGKGIVMEAGSAIRGEGTLKATGGKGYENPGGVGVSGAGHISVERAIITGGDALTVVKVASEGAYGIDGAITVAPETELTLAGGQGVDRDGAPQPRQAAFNPSFDNPQPVTAEPFSKIRLRHVDAETSASIKAHPDLKITDKRLGDALCLEDLLSLEGYTLKHLEFIDHREAHKKTDHEKTSDAASAERATPHVRMVSFKRVASLHGDALLADAVRESASDQPQPATKADKLKELTDRAAAQVPEGKSFKMSHDVVGKGPQSAFDYLGLSTRDLVINAVYEPVEKPSGEPDSSPDNGGSEGTNTDAVPTHQPGESSSDGSVSPTIKPFSDGMDALRPYRNTSSDDNQTTSDQVRPDGSESQQPSDQRARVSAHRVQHLIPKTGDIVSVVPLVVVGSLSLLGVARVLRRKYL